MDDYEKLKQLAREKCQENRKRSGRSRQYDYKEILKLYVNDNLTYKEIAERTGASMGTISRIINPPLPESEEPNE